MEQKLSNSGTKRAKMNLCVGGIFYWIKITNGGKWTERMGAHSMLIKVYSSGNVKPKK